MKYNRPQTKVCGKSCFFGHLHLSADSPDLSTPIFPAGSELRRSHARDFYLSDPRQIAADTLIHGSFRGSEADFHLGFSVHVTVGIPYLSHELATAFSLRTFCIHMDRAKLHHLLFIHLPWVNGSHFRKCHVKFPLQERLCARLHTLPRPERLHVLAFLPCPFCFFSPRRPLSMPGSPNSLNARTSLSSNFEAYSLLRARTGFPFRS